MPRGYLRLFGAMQIVSTWLIEQSAKEVTSGLPQQAESARCSLLMLSLQIKRGSIAKIFEY
jgi:hypothetical protein